MFAYFYVMKVQGYVIIFIFTLLPYFIFSQENEKKRNARSTSFSQKPDTVIKNKKKTRPDTLDFYSKEKERELFGDNAQKSDALYDSIRQIAYKRKLTRLLYDLTFKYSGPKSRTINDTIVKNVGAVYEPFNGKPIGKVEIIRLPPFTADTSKTFENSLSKIGNDVHVLTKEYVIRNNLLFNMGDTIDPVVLTTTARLLRDLPYLDEVNIQVIPSRSSPDSVDVIVVTKDKFPYAVSPVIKSYNDMSFRLWTVNFLGLGHKLNAKISYDGARIPRIKMDEGSYTINNINGSFIKGMVGYTKDNEQKRTWSIKFNRPFVVPTIKQSYGINLYNVKYPSNVTEADSTVREIDILYNNGNVYYAKTYPLSPEKGSKIHPAYISFSSMLTGIKYVKKPFMSADSNLGFRNRTAILGAISVSKNNYYLANYYYSFGKTENIPYGYFAQLTGGYELGTYYNRYYMGFETGAGNFINNLGYYNVRVQIGTYIKQNTGKFNQGVLNFYANLASRLYHLKKMRVRNYVFAAYSLGFERLPGEVITLSSQHGLEGLDNNDLRGTERLATQMETVFFTPWMYYGFTFAFYSFVNISTLVPKSSDLINNRFYTGFGFGIRIRNENLVFETLQLQLAFYPAPPPGANKMNFSSSGISEYSMDGFFVAIPGVYSFR